MSITIDEISQRIASLTATKEQTIANANALEGAIQDAIYWRARLESEAKTESTAEPVDTSASGEAPRRPTLVVSPRRPTLVVSQEGAH